MSYFIVVNSSRFEEDHNLWRDKNKGKVSCSRDKSEETINRTVTIREDEKDKNKPTQSRACDTNLENDQTPETINCSHWNDDLTGTWVREKSCCWNTERADYGSVKRTF